MPYGDRTGPRGQGPMSGRRLGYCSGYDRPGYASGMRRGMGYGRGMGRGRGLGRGFGRGYGPTYEPPDQDRTVPVYREPSPEEEKQYLENLVKDLEAELGDVKARIKELSKKDK